MAVTVSAGMVRIRHGVREVAAHSQARGRSERVIEYEAAIGVASDDA